MGQGGLQFAREALRDLIPAENGKIAIEAIQKAVAVYFHVRLINLMSRRRTQKSGFVPPGRDHSTVIHAHNLIAHRVTNDSTFRDLLDKLEPDLKNRAGKT